MAVFTVDDDFLADDVAKRQYTTIQAAVDAAATPTGNKSGDTVIVRPGYYAEAVVVNKRITLTGAFAPSIPFIGTDPNPDDPSLDPTRASIIDAPAGADVEIHANYVILQGFTLGNADASVDSIGVNLDTNIGNKILSNVIVDNAYGIDLASSTATNNNSAAAATLVIGNKIRNNNEVGAASGNAIYSDQGLRNAKIVGNVINGHTNASIILVGGPDVATSQSKVTIAGNVIGNAVTDEQDAAMIFANLTQSTISGNVMRNIYNGGQAVDGGSSGIFFAGGSSDVKVLGNNLANGAFTGINVRFDDVSFNVLTPNSRITIQGNFVQNWGDGGIRLRDGTFNSIVRANTVLDNGFGTTPAEIGDGFGSGISLEAAINNIVEANVVKFNDTDGIFADIDSDNNKIRNNFSLGNGEHDYHDDSTGLGTAGTANFYKNNKGRTQNRVGLIRFFV